MVPLLISYATNFWDRFLDEINRSFSSGRLAQSPVFLPRKEAEIYQETDFLSTEGHLLTSPGCCLTLSSSLDVV